ncbi:MAG: NUDIX domain-containing protein [Gammaproteobacteria bacterium]|nr:NUDIX domain-containing protein [Gammaproteobacteria bacterium]
MKPKLSAGVVVVHCQQQHFRFLLLRAYRYWDFPKGAVELGESPQAAACRETLEEAGLATLEFHWGDGYIDTPPYAGGKVARYYLAYSPSADVVLGISPELGRPEHQEYRWVNYDTARELVGPRVRAVLDWAHRLIGDRCSAEPFQIPPP